MILPTRSLFAPISRLSLLLCAFALLPQVACDAELDETSFGAETETMAARGEMSPEREFGLRLREAVEAGYLTPEQARTAFAEAQFTQPDAQNHSEVDRFRLESRREFQQFSAGLQASIEAGELSSADAREQLMVLHTEMKERIRAIEADLALQ